MEVPAQRYGTPTKVLAVSRILLDLALRGVGRDYGLAAVDPGAELRDVVARHEGALSVGQFHFRVFAHGSDILGDVTPDTVAHMVGIGTRPVEEEGVEIGDHYALRGFPLVHAGLVDGHDGHFVDPGLVAVGGLDVHPVVVVVGMDLDGRTHQGLGAEFGGIIGIFAHVDDGEGGEGQPVFVFRCLGSGVLCFLFGARAAHYQQGAKQKEQCFFHGGMVQKSFRTTNKFKKNIEKFATKRRHSPPKPTFSPQSRHPGEQGGPGMLIFAADNY